MRGIHTVNDTELKSLFQGGRGVTAENLMSAVSAFENTYYRLRYYYW